MAFLLDNVVPWGRNFDEYKLMFCLDDNDLKKKISGFGDGPASFNCEAHKRGYDVTSFDIIYQFAKDDIRNRIDEVRKIVMEQMAENKDNYVWTKIKSLDDLEDIRMSAMKVFLEDYDKGREENRYIYHELPKKINVEDKYFDIGLSSHFLLMYTNLGYDFHIGAISEMIRICKEVRIFPICDLDGHDSQVTKNVINYFKKNYEVEIRNTEYEFQKKGNKLLIIR